MTSLSRRGFLRATTLLCGGAVATACAASPAASPATPQPTSSIAGSAPSAVVAPPSPQSAPASPSAAPVALASPVTSAASVRGAWVALTANQMILPMADTAGYFPTYGVNFDLSYLNGSANGIAGIVSHSLDMITASGAAVVGAQAADQDLLFVLGFVNQSTFRVMAAADVATIDDVKGQTVAVSKVGSRRMGHG